MNNWVAFGIGSLVGAAVGTGVTYYFVNKKADERIDAEIASVKEIYKNRKPLDISKIKEEMKEEVIKEQASKANLNKPAIQAYSSLAKQYAVEDSEAEETEEKEEEEPKKELEAIIELINADEYGELMDEGYTSEELMYYADNVLATNNYEIVPNVYGDIDKEFERSGEDEIYFRNHIDKEDVAISRSEKTYAEDIADDRARKEKLPNKKE